MNRKLLMFFAFFFTLNLFAQKEYYKKIFDDSFPMEHSVDRNQLTIYSECTEEMDGLLTMYEATKEIKYLQIFVQYAKNVIDKRDDLRMKIPKEAPNTELMPYYQEYGPYEQILNFKGRISPTWSSNYYNKISGFGYNYPNQHDNFQIILNLIKFFNIVKKNSILQKTMVNSKNTVALYHYQYMGSDNKNLNFVAQQFFERALETINFYEENDCWDESIGAFKEFNFIETNAKSGSARYPNFVLPMNMQANIGRVYLEFYVATGNKKYIEKIRKIGKYIKSKTVINKSLNSKSWNYWGGTDPDVLNNLTKKPLREDIPHSSITAIFPYECLKNNILLEDGFADLLFNKNDILQYTNTFLKDIYIKDLTLREGVTNSLTESLNIWNFKTDKNEKNDTKPDKNLYLYENWIIYSEFDPKVYNILNNFINSPNYQSNFNGKSSYIKNHKTLAYLIKYL